MNHHRFPLLLAAAVLIAASALVTADTDVQRFPDVVGVDVHAADANRYSFAVTISSPYDSPERYADAFRVLTPGGETLGVRELLHHHANEQPFTRSLDNVTVPEDVQRVVVEGRDLEYGYGGATMAVDLPGR